MIKNAHLVNNVVTLISRDPEVLPGCIDASNLPVDTGWTWNGTSFIQPVDLAALRKEAIDRVEALLDDRATSWGYDSIYTAATYLISKIPKFAAEAAVLVDWRDSVWYFVEVHQNDYSTVEELLAALPAAPERP